MCSSIFYYLKKIDQRNAIVTLLTVAFGDSTISIRQVQLWYNLFKEGLEEVNDAARPGRPSASTIDENIEAMKKMILDNHQITIREIAVDVDISFGLSQAIFTDVLCMKPATAKIPEFLAKRTSHGHRLGDIGGVQRRCRFAGDESTQSALQISLHI